MIDDNTDSSSNDSDHSAEELDEVSKSQRKREAGAVRDLGVRLSELGASELATIPLPDDVLAAIKELHRIKAHGARKRQLGFLAKRMRHIDVTSIDDALEKLRQTARANTRNLHLVEHWRDRMLGETEGESAKDALTAFLAEFNHADRQQFRHLQRQAVAERAAKRPPAATRQLFKALRSVIIDDPLMRDSRSWLLPITLAALLTHGCATAPQPPPVATSSAEPVNPSPNEATAELSSADKANLGAKTTGTNSVEHPANSASTSQAPAEKRLSVPLPDIRDSVPTVNSKPQLRRFTTATRSGQLQHPEVTEVSGMISSMESRGILFAVNDSGNSAALYALTEDGTHKARWNVDVRNRDWEDMSRAQINGKNYLIIGDTGDNLNKHRRSTLHLLEEPPLNKPMHHSLSPTYSIHFTFEDGPRNVEAFGIAADTVFLITKEPVSAQGAQASRIYTLPLLLPAASEILVARYAGDLWLTKPNFEARLAASLAGVDLNHPTALDFDASGRRAYLLTYRHVVRFTRAQHESWPDAFAKPGTRLFTHDLEQAEALAVDSGRAVFITSEHASAPLWALPVDPPL